MHLHEYQAKELLKKFGLPVLSNEYGNSYEDIVSKASKFDYKVAVKAQIHAGGRGKAGGVKIATSKSEVSEIVKSLLNKRLVTNQTDKQGQIVNTILLEPLTNINKEFYLSVTLDRKLNKPAMVFVKGGGVNVEEESDPLKLTIHTNHLYPYQLRLLKQEMNYDNLAKLDDLTTKIIKLYLESDLSLLEINPLILDGDNELICLDAKISVDSNALFRQKDLALLNDESQEDTKVIKASKSDLNYIPLEGNIGCMVNGAGLAMATMDLIKSYGGLPANFLDVGGGTNSDKVAEAFSIILEDTNVKGILVNIFGGIVKCDDIANGIKKALQKIKLNIPVVVRLEGNNQDLGIKILKEIPQIKVEGDLAKAAKLIIQEVSL
jgi:succinyl-CoA synthetase beta subunit